MSQILKTQLIKKVEISEKFYSKGADKRIFVKVASKILEHAIAQIERRKDSSAIREKDAKLIISYMKALKK